MDIYLFEVEDVFVIKKLGPVLFPGIKASSGLTISVGEKIMLLFPDTQQVTTTIKSFPFINTTNIKARSALNCTSVKEWKIFQLEPWCI